MQRYLALLIACLLVACQPAENVGTATNNLSAAATNVLSISDLYTDQGAWGANGVTYSDAADRCVRLRPTSPVWVYKRAPFMKIMPARWAGTLFPLPPRPMFWAR